MNNYKILNRKNKLKKNLLKKDQKKKKSLPLKKKL